MTTTTLTAAFNAFTIGIAGGFFDLRSSTPTTGDAFRLMGSWRVVESGVVTLRVEMVKDFAYYSRTAVDIYGRVVDIGGNAGSWAMESLAPAAENTAAAVYYINGTSGSDSNDGSSGSPWQTGTKFKTEAEALRASGDEVIGKFSGGATYSFGTTQGWDGDGTVPFRVHFMWDGTSTKPTLSWSSGTYGFVTGLQESLVVDGFTLDGNYASGAARGFTVGRSGAGTRSSPNSVVLNCDFTGWYEALWGGDSWILEDPENRRDQGDYDHLHVEGCTFTGNQAWSMWGMDFLRYFSLVDCSFDGAAGEGGGLIATRLYSIGNAYFRDVVNDTGGIASFRILSHCDSDQTIAAAMASRYISISRLTMLGVNEGLNGITFGPAGNEQSYCHDVDVDSYYGDTAGFRFETNAGIEADNDIYADRFNITNCIMQDPITMKTRDDTFSGVFTDIAVCNCLWVSTGDSWGQGLYFIGTNHARYTDNSFWLVSNGVLWPGTGAGSDRRILDASFMTRAQLAGKFAECDYNWAAKNSTHSANWAVSSTATDSLANWQSNTAHDDNSNVSGGTAVDFDLANDGLGGGGADLLDANLTSGSSVLVGSGKPWGYWVDADGYLHTDDVCGPLQYDTGSLTLPDDPDLGGGGNILEPDAASVTITGYASQLQTDIPVPAASVDATGYSPLLWSAVPVPAASVTITGYAPRVLNGDEGGAAPQKQQLSIAMRLGI